MHKRLISAVLTLVSAIHVHRIPAAAATWTETAIVTETATGTITTDAEEDAANQMKECRFLHANAAKPMVSDSKLCFLHNKTPHPSGAT